MKIFQVAFITALALAIGETNAQTDFIDCDAEDFYSELDGDLDDRSAMHQLLRSKHRRQLPYTSDSKEDVWDALIDLDSSGSRISLVYGSTTAALPYGTSDTWNREHIWPRSRGLFESGIDNVDVRNLFPADSKVNSSRQNSYFSECGAGDQVSVCVSPAHPDAAKDTERDGNGWLPPVDVRGDIARVIFYMEVRYDGDEDGVEDLVLSDDPNERDFTMGYLNRLLAWHEADPVDEKEMKRNDGICEKWQGNRNPFVDYPDLVEIYFASRLQKQ